MSKHTFRPRSHYGFTLLELLVALAIFGFVSIIAYAGMNQVLQGRQHTDRMAQRLTELQLTLHYLERDLSQAVGRLIRDEFGDSQPALSGGAVGEPLISLSRHGWRNPAQHARSHLQRVQYQLDDGALIRTSWFYLDQAQQSRGDERRLIDNIQQIQIRVLDAEQEWHDQWPTQASQLSQSATVSKELPLAVEVVIELSDWGRIRRLMRVGA